MDQKYTYYIEDNPVCCFHYTTNSVKPKVRLNWICAAVKQTYRLASLGIK